MKILVVDDDKTIRAIVEVILEDDWQVLLAESGTEALEIADSESPDLIVLDMHMPGMDGPETIAKLRQNQKLQKTPIVFMTASEETADPNYFTSLGANGAIIKPIDPRTLEDKLLAFVNHS